MQASNQAAASREIHLSINPILAGIDRQLRRSAMAHAWTTRNGPADERQVFAERVDQRYPAHPAVLAMICPAEQPSPAFAPTADTKAHSTSLWSGIMILMSNRTGLTRRSNPQRT